ncbi:IS3 family transposase [Limosilactobacillus fermentum]
MSRKATCLDNAAMESFFHLMKAEMMDEHFENPESLAQAMTEWIEFYNNRRIRTKLKVSHQYNTENLPIS